MIRSQLKPFGLYVKETTINALKEKEESYVYVMDIDVAVHFLSQNRVMNELRFKDCQHSGLTQFKGFDLGKEYKLVGGDQFYFIKSINDITRYTQLLLERVI